MTYKGLEEEFQKAVDDYLAVCSETGSGPKCLTPESTRKIAELGAAVWTAAPYICEVWRK